MPYKKSVYPGSKDINITSSGNSSGGGSKKTSPATAAISPQFTPLSVGDETAAAKQAAAKNGSSALLSGSSSCVASDRAMDMEIQQVPWWNRRSRMERRFFVVAVSLLCVTIGLALGLMGVLYKGENTKS